MKKALIAAALVALSVVTQTANSTTLAGSNTFVGLLWRLSGPGAAGCTEIRADATGDASRSTNIVLYGVMNCPAIDSGFAMTGSAYVGVDGTFNMAFNFGVLFVSCTRMQGASGSCNIVDANGVSVGTMTATLVP